MQRTLEIQQLVDDGAPRDPGQIVLFGDSLSGYYTAQKAGFVHQLMLHLKTPVDQFRGVGQQLPSAIRDASR